MHGKGLINLEACSDDVTIKNGTKWFVGRRKYKQVRVAWDGGTLASSHFASTITTGRTRETPQKFGIREITNQNSVGSVVSESTDPSIPSLVPLNLA